MALQVYVIVRELLLLLMLLLSLDAFNMIFALLLDVQLLEGLLLLDGSVLRGSLWRRSRSILDSFAGEGSTDWGIGAN